MMRLLKAAVADDKPREQLQNSAAHAAREVRAIHKYHQQIRESWGRARWRLLVAERGWGDPTDTNGAYPRTLQGTQEVNFPMYAATWYDQKLLGYYDYVFGGKGGCIYGGGARVGGGMCAGKFDGGNCVALPPRRRHVHLAFRMEGVVRGNDGSLSCRLGFDDGLGFERVMLYLSIFGYRRRELAAFDKGDTTITPVPEHCPHDLISQDSDHCTPPQYS
jgi:hypothetical protein